MAMEYVMLRPIMKDVYMMVVIVVDMIVLIVNVFMNSFVPLEVVRAIYLKMLDTYKLQKYLNS